jgi:hypothetical protein
VSEVGRGVTGIGVVRVTATAASALAILPMAVSGCTGSAGHKEAPGLVAGFAVPCVGVAPATQLQVRVTASEHGHTVATVVAKYRIKRGHYKLVLPPGRYVISARASNDPPRSVMLRAHEHLTVTFPDHCK